jgi:hypothetical protein
MIIKNEKWFLKHKNKKYQQINFKKLNYFLQHYKFFEKVGNLEKITFKPDFKKNRTKLNDSFQKNRFSEDFFGIIF